ncbi:hypothetical protein K491DRAFT_716534 [Lophiostoma macrostomum CBS 122681]|uniref:Uncharacterized protein n=1 Tax=Lophiostoma macrostomum CBS 122681 TaxID=1314788 RepID=A0A6A6T7H2_9PLEO|nr:hypothetical protein K491DRAFT_716534 [Lophiostoma macrostomum CBS 122681]
MASNQDSSTTDSAGQEPIAKMPPTPHLNQGEGGSNGEDDVADAIKKPLPNSPKLPPNPKFPSSTQEDHVEDDTNETAGDDVSSFPSNVMDFNTPAQHWHDQQRAQFTHMMEPSFPSHVAGFDTPAQNWHDQQRAQFTHMTTSFPSHVAGFDAPAQQWLDQQRAQFVQSTKTSLLRRFLARIIGFLLLLWSGFVYIVGLPNKGYQKLAQWLSQKRYEYTMAWYEKAWYEKFLEDHHISVGTDDQTQSETASSTSATHAQASKQQGTRFPSLKTIFASIGLFGLILISLTPYVTFLSILPAQCQVSIGGCVIDGTQHSYQVTKLAGAKGARHAYNFTADSVNSIKSVTSDTWHSIIYGLDVKHPYHMQGLFPSIDSSSSPAETVLPKSESSEDNELYTVGTVTCYEYPLLWGKISGELFDIDTYMYCW